MDIGFIILFLMLLFIYYPYIVMHKWFVLVEMMESYYVQICFLTYKENKNCVCVRDVLYLTCFVLINTRTATLYNLHVDVFQTDFQ